MNIEITGVQAAVDRLEPRELLSRVARGMDKGNQLTLSYIQRNKLSQKGATTLAVRSHRVRGSARVSMARIVGTGVESTMGSNVKYAAVHEYGCGPYTIRARNGKAMRWGNASGIHFARTVRHPGFPARRMFGSGIEECADIYNRKIGEEITR